MKEPDPPADPSDDLTTSSKPPVLDYGVGSSKILDPDALVRIATYTDPFEAELVRAKLESEGIHCSLGGSVLMGGAGSYGAAMRKMDIEVIQRDAERAREVLDQIAERRRQRLRDPGVPETCPNCGGKSLIKSRTRAILTALLFVAGFLLSYWIPFMWLLCFAAGTYLLCTLDRAKWHCQSCGHRWRQIPTPDSDGIQDEDD